MSANGSAAPLLLRPKLSWQPSPKDAWYYSTPLARENPFYTTFVRPWLGPPDDATFGRHDLPWSPREQALRSDPRWDVSDGRAYLDRGASAKGKARKWVFYQVWEAKKPTRDPQADICYCHGINDYGGKFAEHAPRLLEAGYRIIVPDLPSHGRSTGLHAYVLNMEDVAAGVDAVICDVALKDMERAGKTEAAIDERKLFAAGSSMGGFTALLYALQYPPAPLSDAAETGGIRATFNGVRRPALTGVLLLCPMIQIAPESRPSMLVEYFARAISYFAGRFPLAEANRGRNTWDASLEQEFDADPMAYTGKLRIATGLACLHGMQSVEARMHELRLPFKVIHGTSDRATNWRGSQKLFETASSRDKEIELVEGAEHILLRVGRDAEDDRPRQEVLAMMLDWLDRH